MDLKISTWYWVFLYGYGKLPLPPKKMVTWFESEGIPAPELVTSMVSIGEMAAGIGIILGGFFSGILGNVLLDYPVEQL